MKVIHGITIRKQELKERLNWLFEDYSNIQEVSIYYKEDSPLDVFIIEVETKE